MLYSRVLPDDRQCAPLTDAVAGLVKRGTEAARARRVNEALEFFDEALDIDEENVEALLWRGGLSAPHESLRFLERAAILDPGNERVQEGLRWARQRLGLVLRPIPAPPGLHSARPARAPGKRATFHALTGWRQNRSRLLYEMLALLARRPVAALASVILLVAVVSTAALARTGIDKSAEASGVQRTAVFAAAGAARANASAPATQAAASAAQIAPTPTPAALTLDEAWTAENWPQVLTFIEGMLKRSPGDETLVNKKFTAHYKYGVQLVRSDRLAEGIAQFDQALAINAENVNLRAERQFAQLYLEGSTALEKGDYGMAVRPLRTVYDGNPNYRAVKSRLYLAYVGWAADLEKRGERKDAYSYYQKAAYVDMQGREALDGLARLKDEAPAAVKAGKKIEVNLTKQQVIVWENDQVLWRFKVSTGKASAPTRAGYFEILNKIPYATNEALGWGMPNWMGIYQAGGTEDGFHAMLRQRNGATAPTSVLGRPYTTGCVMLSDEDSKKLYDWAMVGTPVWIHY